MPGQTKLKQQMHGSNETIRFFVQYDKLYYEICAQAFGTVPHKMPSQGMT